MREFVEGGSDPATPDPAPVRQEAEGAKESIDLYREVAGSDEEETKPREFTEEVTEIGEEAENANQEPIGNAPEADGTPSFFKSFFVCCVGRK